VPLHTQKGLLAVRSFALPWNIQPNFQNEMIYFRSAHPTVPPSWLCGPLSGLVLLDARKLALRFVVSQRLAALILRYDFFFAISLCTRRLCVKTFFRFLGNGNIATPRGAGWHFGQK